MVWFGWGVGGAIVESVGQWMGGELERKMVMGLLHACNNITYLGGHGDDEVYVVVPRHEGHRAHLRHQLLAPVVCVVCACEVVSPVSYLYSSSHKPPPRHTYPSMKPCSFSGPPDALPAALATGGVMDDEEGPAGGCGGCRCCRPRAAPP